MKRFLFITLLGVPLLGFGVVVKRGDTLWGLCKKHLGNPFLWPMVGEYNKLKNPHLIFPKQRIEFPGKGEIQRGIEIEEGEVLDVSGYVLAGKKALKPQDKIRANEALKTGEDSRAQILFSGGDLITVMEETSLKFEGRNKASGVFSLGIARGRLLIKPGKKARIVTREGYIDLEQGVVLVDYSNLARISVFEGEAYVSGYGKRVLVSNGFGTIITEKGPIDPVKLPKPPVIILPENNSTTGNMRPLIRWSAKDMGRCRVEVASDREFIHLSFNTLSREEEITSTGLAEGNYYLRISGIDNNGLQGKPSEINRFAIERRLGLKYEVVPLFSNLPTRLFTKENKNYISSNSLIYILPQDEDHSISRVLVKVDHSPYFSYKEPLRLKEGTRTISYKPIDLRGEEGEETNLSFIVDGKPPFGELNTSSLIKNGYLTQEATFTITGSDDKSGLSRIQVMVNNEIKEYLGKAEFELSQEGLYRIVYRFEDNVGNLSDENSLSFTLDKNPPFVSLLTEPKPAIYNKNFFLPEENKITLSAEDSPAGVSEILYSIDKGDFSPYTEAFTIKEEGLHIIRYKAIDKAGNCSPVLSNSFWVEPLMYEKYK